MWPILLTTVATVFNVFTPNYQIPPGTSIHQCEYTECPQYAIISTSEEYEVRRYGPTKWASIPFKRGDYSTLEAARAYSKLNSYFTGVNDKDEIINATQPTLGMGTPTSDSEYDATMQLYIPVAFQEDTPVPIDENIHIESHPAMTVYVRAFDGYPGEAAFKYNMQKLSAAIGDASKVVPDKIVGVTYDLVLALWKRRNEVWLFANEDNL